MSGGLREDVQTVIRICAGALLLLIAISLSLLAVQAKAEPSIDQFDTAVGYEDCAALLDFPPPPTVELPVSSAPSDAGAHRDVCTKIKLGGEHVPENFPRTLRIDLPAGVMGNPNAVEEKCPASVLTVNGSLVIKDCPGASQVGTAFVDAVGAFSGRWRGGIFVVESGRSQPARLVVAFEGVVPLIPVTVEARTESDFGITTITPEINSSARLLDLELFLWGVPNANQRGGVPYDNPPGIEVLDPPNRTPIIPPAEPTAQRAFMTNPTVCDGPKTTLLELTFYEPPFSLHNASSEDPTPTNCHALPFEPRFDLRPTSSRADDATGLEVDLELPQPVDARALGTSHLRGATVVLPEGTTLNPAAADGLGACTDAQVGLGTREPARCPEAAKVGTVEFDVPLLAGPLKGAIYLGEPLSTDPQSTKMFRLFQVAEGFGLNVKISGYAKADPTTGRVTAVFGDADGNGVLDQGEPHGVDLDGDGRVEHADGLPQVPFSKARLRFKGGPRGLLATPTDCGLKTARATLTPWSADPARPHSADVVIDSTFAVSLDGNGAPCPATWPFSPSLAAGTITARAGAHSQFSFTLTRQDREQELSGLRVDLPSGLLATVRGVPLCSNAQASANRCPAESQIGTVTAGAGAGAPLFLPGRVFLTEGYKGAPYGLSVAVPAVAGPFDLGTVVVRQAVLVDPTDGHVTVASDPLPTIWHGIPLRLRAVWVDIDRPSFMVNPTDCTQRRVDVVVTSTRGAQARPASPFQSVGCQTLRFRPRLSMRLTGRRQTRSGGHPGLRAVVTQHLGEANLQSVRAELPLSLALDPENAQSDDLCEFEAGQQVTCPDSSIIGRAKAISPLLNRPLEGPVHFVKNVRIHPVTGRRIRTLPTLLIPLRGEIALNLRATSTVERGKLVTTFPSIPDAAVSRFELNLRGGSKGILVVTASSLCRRPRSHVTEVDIDAQNGASRHPNVRVGLPCKRKRSARLTIRSAARTAAAVVVSGTLAPGARGRLQVVLRCGGRHVSKKVGARRRWTARLILHGRCARADRMNVTARYSGNGNLRSARQVRGVRDRGSID